MVAMGLKKDFIVGIQWAHVHLAMQHFAGTPSWPTGMNDSGYDSSYLNGKTNDNWLSQSTPHIPGTCNNQHKSLQQ